MDHQKLFAIMNGKDRSAKAHLMRAGLSCAEPFYRLATGVRNKLFDWGIRKATKLPRPVISIGNITTGGTGKTPMVITLARKLLAMDAKPAVLLRGYIVEVRGISDDRDISPEQRREEWLRFEAKSSTSDEQLVIQDALPQEVAVYSGESRIRSADAVLLDHPDVTHFILDDGFQHRKVERDLNVLLIDATQPFGFNHVLPRGLLRESIANLTRADAIIITRCSQVSQDALRSLDERIERITGRPPLAHTASIWSGFQNDNDDIVGCEEFRPRHVICVSGIGNPQAFETMARHHTELIESMMFPDHHEYAKFNLQSVANRAQAMECDTILTTEKDWVKWRELWPQIETDIPVYRPILDIKFIDGEDALDELIRQRVLNKSV